MDIHVTPLETVAPLTIVKDLGLVYTNNAKIDRMLEELREECVKLGGNAIVRVRFNFEGRGLGYGAAVIVE